MAVAQSTFVAGDITYNIYENVLGIPAPYPSLADAFYFVSYLLFAAGLVLLIRRTGGGGDWGALIDSAIIATGLGLLSWVVLIEPYVEDTSAGLLATLISIDYPLMGVLWLALAARLLFTSGSRPPAYYLLLLAIALHPVADAIYGWLVLAELYRSGLPVDAGWLLFYTSFGAAALHPSMTELSDYRVSENGDRVPVWCLALVGASVLTVQRPKTSSRDRESVSDDV